LIGRKVAVVVKTFAPRKLRASQSNGMIVAPPSAPKAARSLRGARLTTTATLRPINFSGS